MRKTMKMILGTMLYSVLSACAGYHDGRNSQSVSTSTSIPLKDAQGNTLGRIYQSIHAGSYGVQSSTYTSLYDILGTSANASFNIDW